MPTATVVPPGRRRGRALIVGGVVAVVVGLVAAAALSLVARHRVDATVRDLARAPVGCDTTLEFSTTGTFVVYVEIAGRMDDLAGGCDAPARYDRRAAPTPPVDVALVDPSGRDVALGPTDAASYDVAGFRGEPLGEISIDDAGRHVVRVTSPEGGFVVAVGRDPTGAGVVLTAMALAVAAAGVLGGGAATAVGVVRSRRDPPPDPAASPPPPVGPPGSPLPPPTGPRLG